MFTYVNWKIWLFKMEFDVYLIFSVDSSPQGNIIRDSRPDIIAWPTPPNAHSNNSNNNNNNVNNNNNGGDSNGENNNQEQFSDEPPKLLSMLKVASSSKSTWSLALLFTFIKIDFVWVYRNELYRSDFKQFDLDRYDKKQIYIQKKRSVNECSCKSFTLGWWD